MPVVKGRAALRRYGVPEAIPMPLPMPEAPRLAAELRKSNNRLAAAFDAYDQLVEQDRKKQHGWVRDVLGRIIQRGTTSSDRVLARRKYRVTEAGIVTEPPLEASGEPFSVQAVTSTFSPSGVAGEIHYAIEVMRGGALEDAIPRVSMRLRWPERNSFPVFVTTPLQGRTVGTSTLSATRLWHTWAYDQAIHDENAALADDVEPADEILLPDLILVEFV